MFFINKRGLLLPYKLYGAPLQSLRLLKVSRVDFDDCMLFIFFEFAAKPACRQAGKNLKLSSARRATICWADSSPPQAAKCVRIFPKTSTDLIIRLCFSEFFGECKNLKLQTLDRLFRGEDEYSVDVFEFLLSKILGVAGHEDRHFRANG